MKNQLQPLRGGAGSSNVEVQSIGFPGSLAGLPPRTFKILAEHPLILLFSVLGISSLISSSDFITIFLSIELQSFKLNFYSHCLVNYYAASLISLFLFLLEFQEFPLLSNWSTWTQLLLFSSMLSFIVGALSQYRNDY